MTSKDRDPHPDFDIQVGEKRVRISVTPVEWIIILIGAAIIAMIVR